MQLGVSATACCNVNSERKWNIKGVRAVIERCGPAIRTNLVGPIEPQARLGLSFAGLLPA